DGIDAAGPARRLLEVSADVPQRIGTPVRYRQHGRRNVGADDAQAAAPEEAGQDSGAAGRVQHEAARRDLGQPAGQGTLEQAEVQPAAGRAVAAALVALGVERAIAPARVVVLRDGHGRATLTAAPPGDKDRRRRARWAAPA